MKKRFLTLMTAALAATMILTGCGAKQEANSDTFKVGMEAGYAPFNWTQLDDSNGAVKISGTSEYAGGYDVEIAKKIAEGLGKELEIVKTEWDGLVPAVQSGKIDAIIAGMSPTADRLEKIDFSDVYYESDLVLVVKKGSKYENATSLKDFSGAKVTAQLNTFHYTVIDQIEGVDKQTAMDSFPSMRVALEAGAIDAYVSERPEGVSVEESNDNLKMIELSDGFKTSPEDTAIAIGVKKGSDLTDKINEVLAGISQDARKEMMDSAINNQPSNE